MRATNLRTNVAHALGRRRRRSTRERSSASSIGASRATGSTGPRARSCRASNRHNVFARFRIGEGLEYLYDAKAKGLGTIIALPHIGSWEWGGSYLNSLGLGMTAVAEDLEPPELFEWFKAKRESIGIRIEPLDEHAGTVLLQTLKDGGVIGLLCDRDIQGNGIEVEFFGERVRLPAGPATLALRTGATLVAAACYSGPGRDHFAVITPPIAAERRRATARGRDARHPGARGRTRRADPTRARAVARPPAAIRRRLSCASRSSRRTR